MSYAATVSNPQYYKSDPLTHAVGLGDLWSTLDKILGKTREVADTAQQVVPAVKSVVKGDSSVVVVPAGTSGSYTTAGPVGIGIPGLPSWAIPVGIGALAFLWLRRR